MDHSSFKTETADRSKNLSAWFAYGAAAAIFIALATYILALRPGRDSRLCVWVFMITYPVMTLPTLITYLRVRNLQSSNRRFGPGRKEYGGAVLLAAFLIGLLPSLLLAGGRFVLVIPRMAREFGLFLAFFAEILIFVMLAQLLTRILLDERGAAGLTKVEEPAVLRRLRWPCFVLATGLSCTSLTAFSPLYYAGRTGGLAVAGGTIAMVYVGVLLLVEAVRRQGHIAALMAALSMSVYVATGVTYWYLIR